MKQTKRRLDMGEIKSTLDLVMERTRHLSLSAEERDQQKQEDFQKRLQGLLQQYADEALSAEALRERIGALGTECGQTDRQLVVQAVIRRIDPDQDHARWLELISRLAPKTRAPLQDILNVHQEELTALLRSSQKRRQTELARNHGIAGPAVVPNPQQDPQYQKDLAALRHATRSKLDAVGSG